jgi:hypothetical protein
MKELKKAEKIDNLEKIKELAKKVNEIDGKIKEINTYINWCKEFLDKSKESNAFKVKMVSFESGYKQADFAYSPPYSLILKIVNLIIEHLVENNNKLVKELENIGKKLED